MSAGLNGYYPYAVSDSVIHTGAYYCYSYHTASRDYHGILQYCSDFTTLKTEA